MSDQEPFFRPVARIVVLDPARRILLLRYELRDRNLTIWASPGGGLEAGESYEEAALREL